MKSQIKLLVAGAIALLFIVTAIFILQKQLKNLIKPKVLPYVPEYISDSAKIPSNALKSGQYEPYFENSQKENGRITSGYFKEYNPKTKELRIQGQLEIFSFTIPVTNPITCWPETMKTTSGEIIDVKEAWLDWKNAGTIHLNGEFTSFLEKQLSNFNSQTKLVIYSTKSPEYEQELPQQVIVIGCN